MGKLLGEKILKLIQERGITQKDLAAMIGTTEATMSRYISGDRDPKAEVLANIATALHTTTDYLLGIEETGDPVRDFPHIERLIARNAQLMSPEQKKALIAALFES